MAKSSPLVDKKALGCPRFVLVIKVVLSRDSASTYRLGVAVGGVVRNETG